MDPRVSLSAGAGRRRGKGGGDDCSPSPMDPPPLPHELPLPGVLVWDSWALMGDELPWGPESSPPKACGEEKQSE